MKCGFSLDLVFRQCEAILQLPPGKDEALACQVNMFHLLNLLLDTADRICDLNLKRQGLPFQIPDEDLHQSWSVTDDMV